ncbi:MAG: hypothetical protein QXO03_00290 [Thermoplasmatales archaeon]
MLDPDAGTVLMNGIGDVYSALAYLKYLKRFGPVRYLYVSTFIPSPDTPWEVGSGASVKESLDLIK